MSAPSFDQCQFICLSWLARFALRQLLSRVDLQLLNIAFHGFTQIGNQVEAVGDLNGRRRALASSIGVQARPPVCSWSLARIGVAALK
jgi:hypothetical protein